MNDKTKEIVFGKKYFFGSLILLLLNLGLIATLIINSFAQTQDLSRQTPVKVQVMPQNGSPILLNVVNINMSNPTSQIVNYKFLNVTNKPVRALVLLADGKKVGTEEAIFFNVGLISPGGESFGNLPLERRDIQNDENVFLSIDYVEFADGTFWGRDERGKSKVIAGQREGAKFAIGRLKFLIKNQTPDNSNELLTLLGKDLKNTKIPIPNNTQSKEWNKGFQNGFKSIISYLQRKNNGGVEMLLRTLEDFEKSVN